MAYPAKERTTSKCNHCGVSFTHRVDKPSKYCSQDCYHQGKRKVEHRVCIECGETFTARPFEKKVMCSVKCKARRESAIRQAQRAVDIPPRACEQCGNMFTPSSRQSARRGGRFCSVVCVGKANRRHDAERSPWGSAIKDRPPRECIGCGAEYKPRHDSQKFCSYTCPGHHSTHTSRCVTCGVSKVRKDGIVSPERKFFCSDMCRSIHDETQELNDLISLANLVKRVAVNVRRQPKDDQTRQCQCCGKHFVARVDSLGKYCSRRCVRLGRELLRKSVTISA
jgi:hypothetical protein